jgi:hypothetical protein
MLQVDPDHDAPRPGSTTQVRGDRPPGSTGAGPGPSRRRHPGRARLLLLAGGGFALLAGLDAALLLLGVGAPVAGERIAAVHGVLMVLGFVGTLIALERAVALARWWGFASPALLGLGGIALVSPLPLRAAGALLIAGTALQAAIFVPLWRRRRDAAVLVQALGAVGALGGAVLFTGGASATAYLGWLVGFVVLLIAGERMELARLIRSGGKAENAVLACGVGLLVGVMLTTLFPRWGPAVCGAALLATVVALVRVDVASRMWRARALPRFSALCLLAGYAWLTVAGGTLLLLPDPLSGGAYDAVVHAVFLGFTMSMIFAHASVILPAVLRRPLPYHPVMYAPAVLLHAALAVRVVGGDLRGARLVWQIGGVGNVVAVLGFAVTAAFVAVTASRRARRRRQSRTPTGDRPVGVPPSVVREG